MLFQTKGFLIKRESEQPVCKVFSTPFVSVDYDESAIALKPSYLQSETYSTPLPIVHMTIKYTSEAKRGVNELEEEPE